MYIPSRPPDPIEIEKFLGLNEAIGETEIILGEAVKQINFRITQNFKAQKRTGHKTFLDYENEKNVQGLWYGTIADKEVLISCNDGKVYEYDFDTAANTQIGTFTDAKTSIFYFEGKLYFLNGTDYKEYNGTTFQDVDPYIPTVAIGTPPAGGGTAFEPINLLTGKKKQEFVADGTATEYQVAETGLDAALTTCTIDGVTKTELTHYTVNRTTGKFNFAAGTSPHGAPTDESEVILGWTKTESGNADLVKKNRFSLINGPGNDTAVFLWGNPEHKNRRTWSGTLKANYFPAINYTYVGSDEYAITDIKPQYDRQLIFKEDKTHYSYPEWNATAEAWDYPVYDLKETGNITFNGVQLVKNSPISISGNALWQWTNTSVEDERDADIISQRIKESLSSIDLTKAITFDYEKEKEYWCNVADKVYIWNYGNNTFYIYNNITATCFLNIKGEVYYGSKGTIERFGRLLDTGEPILDDNGSEIVAELELGFNDFGVNQLLKNSRNIWFTIQPYSSSSLTMLWQTDKKILPEEKGIEVTLKLFDYGRVDYEDWTYETNRSPRPFRKKIRAKKYAYIKLIFKNSKVNDELVILSIKLTAETTSEVK